MVCGPYLAPHLFLFYWNTATPTFYILLMDAFSRTAELSNCNNDSVAHKTQNVYYDLALYRRSLMTQK